MALQLSGWEDLRPEGQAFALMVEERLRVLFPNGWEREKALYAASWLGVAQSDLVAASVNGQPAETKVGLAVDVAAYALVLADCVMREAAAEEELSHDPSPTRGEEQDNEQRAVMGAWAD